MPLLLAMAAAPLRGARRGALRGWFAWSLLWLAPLPLTTRAGDAAPATRALALVSEVPLPGSRRRFDYQDLDAARGHLFIAHMGDDELLVLDLRDGRTLARVPGLRSVRGVRVASEANLVFATVATDELVRIDATTLREIGRTPTSGGPDGVDWDPLDHVVAVSDQRDGAVSLIAGDGAGRRFQVPVGLESGNVAWDPWRRRFWVTAVRGSPPDRLVAIDPLTGDRLDAIALPGCEGAHGLRLDPDGASALVACERNGRLLRVALAAPHALASARVGSGPDVLAIDPGLRRLYVASEAGELDVFDLASPELGAAERERIGEGAHTVAVDPATHRVFLPLPNGRGGPVLRIMAPLPR